MEKESAREIAKTIEGADTFIVISKKTAKQISLLMGK